MDDKVMRDAVLQNPEVQHYQPALLNVICWGFKDVLGLVLDFVMQF